MTTPPRQQGDPARDVEPLARRRAAPVETCTDASLRSLRYSALTDRVDPDSVRQSGEDAAMTAGPPRVGQAAPEVRGYLDRGVEQARDELVLDAGPSM